MKICKQLGICRWLIIKFTVCCAHSLSDLSISPLTFHNLWQGLSRVQRELASSGLLTRCWNASARMLREHCCASKIPSRSWAFDVISFKIFWLQSAHKLLRAYKGGAAWKGFKSLWDHNLWACYFLKVQLQPKNLVFYDMAVFRWGNIWGLKKKKIIESGWARIAPSLKLNGGVWKSWLAEETLKRNVLSEKLFVTFSQGECRRKRWGNGKNHHLPGSSYSHL